MSINGQGHSLTLVKGHSDFKVKCLNFGLYTQVSDSGPLGPLVYVMGRALSGEQSCPCDRSCGKEKNGGKNGGMPTLLTGSAPVDQRFGCDTYLPFYVPINSLT